MSSICIQNRGNRDMGVIQPFEVTQKVLIVDDNTDNCFCLGFAMKAWNVETAAALSGQIALDKIQDQKFDFILMDMRMPGLSGNETIARIKADKAIDHAVIIAVTAQAMPGDREKCLANGADEYISKPFDLIELREAMEKLSCLATV